MKKKNPITILITIFSIVCLFIAIYSSYKIILWKNNTNKNNKIKEQINELINIDNNENLKNKYKIDFDKLKEQNPDTVAWLKVNGTNIEYPVVKSTDNNYYLSHNFNNEKNIAGWIFADYRNKFDKTDKNIIIYGHNTKDGSMFETLTNTLKKEWQEQAKNTIIILVTEEETYLYQVFSTYDIIPEDYYITTNFDNSDDYTKFLNTIKDRSNYDYKINVDSNNSILTLSSCIGDGSKRVVVHAKKIY